MVLTLYKLDGSPPVTAVRMTIELLKIPDVQFIDIVLLKGEQLTEEFLKINPHHTVPTLKDDDFIIWDSHAICSYLVSIYGNDDSLYPADPKKRAVVDQRLHFDSGILYLAARGATEPVLFNNEKTFRLEELKKITSAYELTDKLLTTDWIAGDNLTLADLCCISSISSMDVILPIDEEKYKNLWAWFQKCSQLECYKTMNEPGLELFRILLKKKMG